MYVGNVMLLVLNLPLVGLFGRIAAIRTQIIIPVISIICLFGVYSIRNSFLDVWVMIIAGVIGYILRQWKFPMAPFIIGIVLGPTTENSIRQTLMMFRGDIALISGRPIAMVGPLVHRGECGCPLFRKEDRRRYEGVHLANRKE